MKNIGVLGFQGGVIEHKRKLELLGANVVDVRYPQDLQKIDAIILPGGESTCIRKLLYNFSLMEPLAQKISDGLPAWGTCAGAILLSQNIDGQENETPLGLLNIKITRNSYGSQLDSFQCKALAPAVAEKELDFIFIRAPRILSVGNASTIATINDSEIVAVRQNHILATTFHPELATGCDFHRYFLQNIVGGVQSAT